MKDIKTKKLKSLKEEVIANLKGYKFNELVSLLNSHNDYTARDVIMSAMEYYYPVDFMKWIESC